MCKLLGMIERIVSHRTRKLYWTDALHDRIDACDLNGNRRTVIVKHPVHPFGLALTGTHVYWTDWYNKSVFRAPLSNSGVGMSNRDGRVGIEIRHGLRGALDLRTVSRKRQPSDAHPCVRDNGGCSHLCLFRWNSYVCACPDQPADARCRVEGPRPFAPQVALDDEDAAYDSDVREKDGRPWDAGREYGAHDADNAYGDGLDGDDFGNDGEDDQMKWFIAIVLAGSLLGVVLVTMAGEFCDCRWSRGHIIK